MGLTNQSIKLVATVAAVACIAFFIKCNVARKTEISSAELSKGQGSSGSIAHKTWTQYGGGPDQSKYVDLKQITKENVSQLQVAWEYQTKDNSAVRFNPLIVDNVMYVIAKNSSVVALDVIQVKKSGFMLT